jgi:hypothetical protein
MFKIFKKDSIIFGIILGIVLPGILYAILLYTKVPLRKPTSLLLSLSVNMLTIRYYFVNIRYDRTGRGILLVTFISGILFFIVRYAL